MCTFSITIHFKVDEKLVRYYELARGQWIHVPLQIKRLLAVGGPKHWLGTLAPGAVVVAILSLSA